MSKKKFSFFLTFFLFCSISFFAKDKHFKRIEEYPSGEQTKSVIGSFFSGTVDVNTVEYVFDATLDKVWPAIKQVAKKFAKVSGRIVVGINESNYLIQNGKISQDSMIGSGSGAWRDEFQMQALSNENKTKVIVARKVVQKEFTGKREWKTQLSNGKIENYLLTQIEDELNKPSLAQEGDEVGEKSFSVPGKYFKKGSKINFIELKSDGTFETLDSGVKYIGSYGVAGNEITCMIKDGNGLGFKLELNENIAVDTDGTNWIKADIVQKKGTSEILTNEDIIKMVKAKLSNKLIIAKIHKANCDFDTNIDVLIELKKSGVNDEIIQVMTEVDSK